MRREGLAGAKRFLVFALSALYAVAAVASLIVLGFDSNGSVLAAAVLVAGRIALARRTSAPA
jgi:hypothetical protein